MSQIKTTPKAVANKNETDNILVSKVECLSDLLETTVPDESQALAEFTRYVSVWDEIDAGIIKEKIMELVKQF